MDVLESGPEGGWERPRGSLVPALLAALAVAVAAAVALAVALYVDRRQTPEQEAVVRAIERYTAGWNAHDADAVQQAMTYRATFTAGDNLQRPLIGPLYRDEFPAFLRRLFDASVSLRTTGEPDVTGTGPWQVAVRQTARYQARGIQVSEEAVSLYFVVLESGRPMIQRHIWWRPGTETPSMLWIQ